MVFAPLKDMSYKDIKITTSPIAPMTSQASSGALLASLDDHALVFGATNQKPSTLSQVWKAILFKSEEVGAAGEDACAQDGHENVRSAVFCGVALPNSMSPTWQKHIRWFQRLRRLK